MKPPNAVTTGDWNFKHPGRLILAIDRMFDEPAVSWWKFVGCAYCNAWRQEECQSARGASSKPHAGRIAAAFNLHGTLWLLAQGFEADVIGSDDA